MPKETRKARLLQRMSELVPGAEIQVGGKRFTVVTGDGYAAGSGGWNREPRPNTIIWVRKAGVGTNSRAYTLRGTPERVTVQPAFSSIRWEPFISGPVAILEPSSPATAADNRVLDLPLPGLGLTLRVGLFPAKDELVLAYGTGEGKDWHEMTDNIYGTVAIVLPASALQGLAELLHELR